MIRLTKIKAFICEKTGIHADEIKMSAMDPKLKRVRLNPFHIDQTYKGELIIFNVHPFRGLLEIGLILKQFFEENPHEGESFSIEAEEYDEESLMLTADLELLEKLELTVSVAEEKNDHHDLIRFKEVEYKVTERAAKKGI